MAEVRGALWLHLAARTGRPAPAEARDPNRLLPCEALAEELEALARWRGEGALRFLAHDYVDLWARTFRNLVRHLRGQPERALSLLVSEVYPFLTGDRRAARVEEQAPGRARIVALEGLPPVFLASLIAAFVGLSGAHVTCEPKGHEVYEVRYRIPPADRLARAFSLIARMRVPFLLSALVAALLGIAATGADAEPWRVAVVLVGVLGVQGASNALHDLRVRHQGGPFEAPRPPRYMMLGTVTAGYTGGALAAAVLVWTGTPYILLWVAAGLVLSLLYGLVQDAGYGPFLAGLTYGPLVVTGALHAVSPATPVLEALLASLPLGTLAAAVVYLNDLADRPLDKAAGRRTLLVRLPRRSHVIGFAVLLGVGMAGVVLAAWWHLGFAGLASAVLLAPAGWLVTHVAAHVDDPHALAPARMGTLALHLASGLGLAALFLESL